MIKSAKIFGLFILFVFANFFTNVVNDLDITKKNYLIGYSCGEKVHSINIALAITKLLKPSQIESLQSDLLCDGSSGSAVIFSVSRLD